MAPETFPFLIILDTFYFQAERGGVCWYAVHVWLHLCDRVEPESVVVNFPFFPCPTFSRQPGGELWTTARLSHISLCCCLYLLFPWGSWWWEKWAAVFLNSLSCGEIRFILSEQPIAGLLSIFLTVQAFLFLERSSFYYVYFGAQTIEFISKIELEESFSWIVLQFA